MDNKLQEALSTFLTDIASQARADAIAGQSNIGSIFDTSPDLQMIDSKKVQDLIISINQAAKTKEATRRIVNAILVAAKIAADQLIK
jgi:hypothetical protein